MTPSEFGKAVEKHLATIGTAARTTLARKAKLRAYYAIGKVTIRAVKDRAAYGSHEIANLARRSIGICSCIIVRIATI